MLKQSWIQHGTRRHPGKASGAKMGKVFVERLIAKAKGGRRDDMAVGRTEAIPRES